MTDLPPAQPNLTQLQIQQAVLAQAVGSCLMAWSQVESQLLDLFISQIVCQSRNKQRYVIARGIWSAVINFETRVRMIDAAISGSLYKLEQRRFKNAAEDWRLLLHYTKTMATRRNEIAHGTITNYDNKEMMIKPYATTIPTREGISINGVTELISLFVELSNTLSWFSWLLASFWKRNLRRLVLTHHPTPDLILRLRKQKRDRIRAAQIRKRKRARRGPARRQSQSRRGRR
jgi:hypothetical protein